jgi:hypothetical protein
MSERILISDLFRNARLTLVNGMRLLRQKKVGYIVLRIDGSFPERTPQPRRPFPLSLLPWPPPPTSVQAFSEALDRIAADPRRCGVHRRQRVHRNRHVG